MFQIALLINIRWSPHIMKLVRKNVIIINIAVFLSLILENDKNNI